MSESLDARWSAVRRRGRAALIPYVTAGFPDAAATRAFLEGAADAGADIVELGVPWSDPVADGPVIQASTHAALAGGMTLAGTLDLLARARPALPVVVFSYLNPILAFGAARFAARAAEAGAAGILVTDLPAGTDPGVEQSLGALPLIRLVAPTTTPARLSDIVAASAGFIYLIARTGVTGRQRDGAGAGLVSALVSRIRMLTDLPIAVGFGISEPSQAAEVAALADGVVVGSALVERLASGGAGAGLQFVRELRAAIDGAAVAR